MSAFMASVAGKADMKTVIQSAHKNCSIRCSVTLRDDHERAILTGPYCRPLSCPPTEKLACDQGDRAPSGLVHNHPSGDPTPSRDDIDMTKAIVDIARPLGISV